MNIEEIAKDYFNEAQRLFGPMLKDWIWDGIEFNDCPPHIKYLPLDGIIKISLSYKARENDIQLRFQLAHEVCHALYPQKDRKTLVDDSQTVLNEGISTFFSITVLQNLCNINDVVTDLEKHSPNYYQSFCLTNKLLGIDNEAIIKLRIIEPKINRLRNKHFKIANINAPIKLTYELLRTFE